MKKGYLALEAERVWKKKKNAEKGKKFGFRRSSAAGGKKTGLRRGTLSKKDGPKVNFIRI
jgi:hypothetical protein